MSGSAQSYTYDVDDRVANKRLDKAISVLCPEYSRTLIKKMIVSSCVTVNGIVEDNPSAKVSAHDKIILTPSFENIENPNTHIEPENIPIDIVFEDDDLIILNKPAGLVVHPGAGNWSGTLINALLYHRGNTLSDVGGAERPGLVHRLDKDTSGLIAIAKTNFAHRHLAEQLSTREMKRTYHAFVWGVPTLIKGSINAPMIRHPKQRTKMSIAQFTDSSSAREAITHYTVLESYGEGACLMECNLETGRTHQIRVHCEYLGHSIIGDPLYGAQDTKINKYLKMLDVPDEKKAAIRNFPRQALHAKKLTLIHPRDENELSFECDYPSDFVDLAQNFNI